MWRLIYSIPIWILYVVLIYVPLIILGWVLIPIHAALGRYEYVLSKYWKNRCIWVWKDWYMAPYQNHEDGLYAGLQYKNKGSFFKQIVYWNCSRNPVNGLRWMPVLSCKINPLKISYRGSVGFTDIALYDTKTPQWFYAWQNIFHSNFYWQFLIGKKLYRFWIGTCKIYPQDMFGLRPSSYRYFGSGPVIQFKRVT